jgi:3-keto-disaccharide hydrolase
MKTTLTYFAALLVVLLFPCLQQDDGWISLFDGHTLDGWKASEHPETFTVSDGMIVVHGERAHLFYVGDVKDHNFTDFDWKADVMTTPGSNSGMYIHTAYQDEGWPSKGIEIQVNNSHTDWRRTGSVYALKDVKEAPAKDDEWFTQEIIVKGKNITVKVNGKTINKYTDGEGGNDPKLSSGTFALQGHDPNSKVYYKNIMVKFDQ